MKIERRKSFTHFGDSALKWPNSAACFADGRIAIADSGNDRAVIIGPDGAPVWSGGGRGFAPGKLREPIGVFVTPDQYLIVSDWHNHRLVLYRPDLVVSHQIGHLGVIDPPRGITGSLRLLRSFIANISIGQFGVDRYFTHGKDQHPSGWFSPAMLLRGLAYYALHPGAACKIFFDRDLAMLKPNGAVFPPGDQILITQKGLKCLSLYKTGPGWKDTKLVRHVHSFGADAADRFDRLSNIAMDGAGRVYVCDQQNYRVVVLNPDLTLDRILPYSKERPDGPFSCCIIDDRYIAAVAGFTLEIRDLETGDIVHEDDTFDETHGIAWDPGNRFLYVVDRSGHAIHQIYVGEVA